ncbi:MAG: hypothetical protein RLY61_152 [Candidatus Parcubacteria bacterium]|jgi:mannose-6-phosphate isomerase-like protein (cupin superfamily)
MKKGFKDNIEQLTLQNSNFRKIIYTAKHSQLVLMTLKPREDIGVEIHKDGDQFFRFEAGKGKVVINETTYLVKDGDAVTVPAGAKHNVINTSEDEDLKLYTIYSPPHHKDGIIRKTKQEAKENEAEFDGKYSE